MKEDIGHQISVLLGQLIQADFPTLRSHALTVRVEGKCDFITAISSSRGKIVILVCEKDIRRMDLDACTGALVHELCHAERDLEITPPLGFTKTALQLFRPRQASPTLDTTSDERATDELVMKKGYGKQLLAFQKYHDGRYKRYKRKDGLTRKEIRKRLMKAAQNPGDAPSNT